VSTEGHGSVLGCPLLPEAPPPPLPGLPLALPSLREGDVHGGVPRAGQHAGVVGPRLEDGGGAVGKPLVGPGAQQRACRAQGGGTGVGGVSGRKEGARQSCYGTSSRGGRQQGAGCHGTTGRPPKGCTPWVVRATASSPANAAPASQEELAAPPLGAGTSEAASSRE
jgi:hypothetical protein